MTVENEQQNTPEAQSNENAEAAENVEATEPETTESEATESEATEAEEAEADSDQPKRDPRIPEVITTRTLFFLAPDLPPASERQAPSRRPREEPEEDDTDEEQEYGGRRSGRGRGRSRRGSRGQERRDGRDSNQRDNGQREDDRVEEVEEKEPITEPQKVQGSTRLAAKRARRREGRDSGRRRVAVTESEFQARRESVDRKMLVRSKNNRVQIGVLEDDILVEHYVARNEDVSLIGNVYVGRVQNVLPSMEAAFIDIGGARNAVLYSGEVDWAAAEMGANQPRKIENALKSGDKVLVQVTKDPVGHKGARLTSQVSLPGRYLVYVPGNTMNGISRKLPDTERARLKKILKEVLPEGVGVIVRTAAEGATQEQLQLDVERLTKQWEDIQRKAKNSAKAPQTLHAESDMLVKIVRDVFNEDFDKLIVQGQSELDTIKTYLGQVAPDLVDRVERYNGGNDDIFGEYRVNDMIDKALARKVWLPSGGSLVIDRTEAMTVVDVNTGKFVGTGGNLEETVTKNNLEAAEEIVRQLRLRDIGGIIVIDFIDMVLESNRDLVQRRLVEGLSRDRTKHQVAELTSLGLVQMTRKKIGLGLLETFSEPCTHCDGRGVVIHGEPVSSNNNGGQSSGGGRKGRGSRNRGKGQQQNSQQQDSKPQNGHEHHHNNGATHEITEDTRNALTKIASSTIGGAGEAHAQAPEVQEVVDAATKEIVKVVKELESNKSAQRDNERDGRSKDAGARSKRQRGESSGSSDEQRSSEGQGSLKGQDRDKGQRSEQGQGHEDGQGSERSHGSDRGQGSEKGSSRRSRRNRRVRTEAPSARVEAGGDDAKGDEQPQQERSDRASDASLTIDLPAPVEHEADAPRDPQQVEAALSSLDAALDSLISPSGDSPRDDSADAKSTAEAPVEAEAPTEAQAPVAEAKPESAKQETASSSTSSRRKRGARRRITTGPISTGSGEES
ncbi:Rne/Rng family ribonuclease [Gulosibacter molinativorax]|uniref:Rne/Rng family ribonuclease n=1 Tax=Gulosibacter molinativorax TaxID=256821 RepID=UPI0004145F5B|nr:Rne/Rng family ribonuclease [Gulosibacter molinativorax]